MHKDNVWRDPQVKTSTYMSAKKLKLCSVPHTSALKRGCVSKPVSCKGFAGKYNEMETVCEFCGGFRPVVYCKADAARLCLSCDAKVHSANALSNRHLRTLLCDACNYRPCSVRCLEHSMFMCHGCNSKLHIVSSQHQRRTVSCFTVCPSAKDFATMWGFRSNKGNDNSVSKQFLSVSCADSDAGSNSQQVYMNRRLQEDNGFIFPQILELEKLQLSERNDHEQTDITSSVCEHPEEIGDKLNHGLDKSHDRIIDTSHPVMDLSSSPFHQVEHLSSSSSAGDSFWRSEGPSQDNQLWYQNLQDIGVCQDLVHTEDFNIPDIDLTFRNFEELFGMDYGNNVSSSSSVKKDASIDESDNDSSRTAMDASPSNRSRDSVRSGDSLCALRHDTDLSPKTGQELSGSLPGAENLHLGGRENSITRLREKRKTPDLEKQDGCSSHGARNNLRRQMKGRLAKTLSCGGVTSNPTS